VPATTVNWGGDEAVSLQEWCTYLGGLVGREPDFLESDQALGGVPVDLSHMHELIGGTTVGWREGMRRLVATFHPELVA
jgi:UDP-glucuronate 4-epimerase